MFFVQNWFDKWYKAVQIVKYRKREKNFAQQKADAFRTQRAFYHWKTMFEKRQQDHEQEQVKKEQLLQVTTTISCFNCAKTQKLVQEKIRLNVLRKYFKVWYSSCFQNLNTSFHSLRAEHGVLQQKFMQQNTQFTDVDLMNQELSEQLEQLSSELSSVQFTLTQKNVEMVRRRNESGMVKENERR